MLDTLDDSMEMEWIRKALEERNILLAEQNKLLEEIKDTLRDIYGGMP